MAKLIISDFTLGLAPKHWNNGTTFGNRFNKPGQLLSENGAPCLVNPFYQPGYLIPGVTTFTAITNQASFSAGKIEKFITVDDNIIDTTSGTSIYGIQAGGIIHAINPSTKTLIITGEWPRTLDATGGTHDAHTTFIGDDIVEYQLNGTRKVFYSYRDNTDGDISTWDGSTFIATEDVFSTSTGGAVLSKTFPIKLIPSQNGFLYILNGSSIHKFDGTTDGGSTGTATLNVLTVPNHKIFVDAADHLGKMWILVEPKNTKAPTTSASRYVLYPTRDISVIIWDRDSTIISTENTLRISDCSEAYAIFPVNGVIHVLGRGTDPISAIGVQKLWAYNGTKFSVVKEIGSVTNGLPGCRGSIISYQNGILWQDVDGVIWWYGNVVQEGDKVMGSLFQVSRSGASVGGGGSMIAINGANILVERQNSGTLVGNLALGSSTSAGSDTNLYLAPIELPKLSTINGITFVFFAETNANTGTWSFDIYNKNNATVVTKSIDLDVDIPKGYAYFPLALEKSNIIALKFSTTSGLTMATVPKIMRIEIDYTPTPRLK